MKADKLFLMPIRKLNNYIKSTLVKTYGFQVNTHNVIEFGNKKIMLKCSRIHKDGIPLTEKQFEKETNFLCHLNQVYIDEMDSILLCLIFKDKCKYITISKKELKPYKMSPQHKKNGCYQCDIKLKKFMKNEVCFD